MKFIIRGLLHTREISIKKRIADQRKGSELMAKGIELPSDVKSEIIDINGIKGVWYVTPEADEEHFILYFHGGAYVTGSPDTEKGHSVLLSRLSNAKLLSIDYRLAPEHPFPAALDDAVEAYKWLIKSEGISPKNVVIAGTSAGGGLTMALLLKLRDIGIELPAAALCISAWADLALTGESFRTKAKNDPFLTPDGLEFNAKLYVSDNDPRNPYISPVYGDLHDLPSLYLNAGTAEILYDDTVRLGDLAKKAGIEVEIDIWDEMIHAFPAFANFVPESDKAIEKMAEFIKKHLK